LLENPQQNFYRKLRDVIINYGSKHSEISFIKYMHGIMALTEGFCKKDNDCPGYIKETGFSRVTQQLLAPEEGNCLTELVILL
jgi:hypothetical protein